MSKSQQYDRHIPAPTVKRKAIVVGFRQKGYAVGRYGRPPISDERVLELGGEAALRAYREGMRVGERERAR